MGGGGREGGRRDIQGGRESGGIGNELWNIAQYFGIEKAHRGGSQ